MSLILRWRVPDPSIATRWRGPCGLVEAIARDPFYPVATVVGPPGSGGTAAFPPLALAADDTQPVPAAGVGAGAWSTLLDQPMFWDGAAWRTIAHFCSSSPGLDWVPQGAIAVSDFANDRYWRADIGVCGLADLWTVDTTGNWYPYDPATAVVPGIGLTTGDVSTIDSPWTIQAPLSTPELFALIAAAGGCSAFGVFEDHTSAPYEAGDTHGFTVGYCHGIGPFHPEIGSSAEGGPGAAIPAGLSRMSCSAWPGPGEDRSDAALDMPSPTRVANSLDFANGIALTSADGATGPSVAHPGDYSGLDTLAAEVHVHNAHGNKTMRGSCSLHVIFPPLSPDELNALTAPAPPVNLDLPVIAGTPRVGETLTATSGTWTNSPSAFAYQWRADGIAIDGATSASQVLTENELGSVMTVTVIATNAGGSSAAAVSAGTDAVAPAPTVLLELDFTAGTLPEGATFARAGTGTASYFDDAGLMQIAAADQARFDHDPVTLALRGLLIEPAATNLIIYSEALTGGGPGWGPFQATVTDNAVAAPDGNVTADTIVENTADNRHIVYYDAATVVIGSIYTASSHFKPAGRNYGGLALGTTGARYGRAFDLTGSGAVGGTGTSGSPVNTGAGIERSAAGFYRCSVTAQAADTAAVATLSPSDSLNPTFAGDSPTYLGDGSSGVHVWGHQLELGSVPTSYIPTSGSTATRAADALSFTVPAGVATLRCTIEGGTADIPVTPGPVTLTAADFGGVPVWLQEIEGLAG